MRPVLLLWVVGLLAAASGCGQSPQPAEHSVGSTFPPATTTSRCGPQNLVATTQEQPTPICLTVGVSVHVTTQPSPHQPWSLPTSSDESVLHCSAQRLVDGAAAATCTALRAGTAIVSTGTVPFAGDPHGPPQSQWELHVTIA